VKAVIRLLARATDRFPIPIVVVTVVLFGVFGALARNIEVAQGNEGFAPDNPEIAAAERIGELFGADSAESVLQVVVRASGGDVITADALAAVTAASEAIREAAGDALSARPDRPAIVSYLTPVERALAFQGISADQLDDAGVKRTYTLALSQAPQEQVGFLTGLLGGDADPEQAEAPSGLILVFLQSQTGGADPFEAQLELETRIADAVRAVDVPGVELRPFSFALLFEDRGDFNAEIGRLFAMAALIIVAILLFVFWMKPRGNTGRGASIRRTVADMGLTMVTILLAITFMQGIGYLLLRAGVIDAFSPPTQIVPILLIGLGVDYAIHLIARYREEVGEGRTVAEGVRQAIGTVGVALALATVTTVVGFLTNVFNPVPALKDFGILAAVGILVAFVLMLTFVPAVRLLADRRAERTGRLPTDGMAQTGERLLPVLMEKAAILAERAAVPTLVVTLLLGAVGAFGLSQLETEFSVTDFLPEDAPAVQTLRILQEEFGGGFGETSQVLVEAPAGGDLATPEVHNALVSAWRKLADVHTVLTFDLPTGRVASANSPVAVISQLLRPGPGGAPADPAFAQKAIALGLRDDLTVAPDTDVAALWTAAAEAAPDEMTRVLHRTDQGAFDAVLFDIQTQAGERRAAELREGLLDAFAPVSDLGLSVIATSENIITAVIVQALSSSQVSSLLVTILVATLVLMVNFWFENRRPFLGVLTMIPVALVVLWTFGLMWLTGIPFGPVTATLAALAVGIGVPFTIHIARRFEEDRVRFDDLEDALRSTTRHTGGALAGSAFTTMAGFGILMTSSLKPFQQMGQVTVYAIGFSLAGAVLVLPSLLALWERYHRRRGRSPVDQPTVPVA